MVFGLTMVLALSGIVNNSVLSVTVNALLEMIDKVYCVAVDIGGVFMLNCIDISTVAVIVCWFGKGCNFFTFKNKSVKIIKIPQKDS